MRCCAFIFARGGSKGVKGKNLRPFAGAPLIAHAIQVGQACTAIDDVIVSTDDTAIAEVAEQFGATVPFIRPAALAQDDSPEWLAWQHAITMMQAKQPFDLFVSLPPTAPLRAVSDVERCIHDFQKKSADMLITVTPANRNPYFNMVTLSPEQEASLVIPSDQIIEHRQSAPAVYDMATVAYVAKPDFILRHSGLFDGRVIAVEVPAERAIDIDTELDFMMAEFLYHNNTRG